MRQAKAFRRLIAAGIFSLLFTPGFGNAAILETATLPCIPGDVAPAEDLICIDYGRTGKWVKNVKLPERCREGQEFMGGPARFYICHVDEDGNGKWTQDTKRLRELAAKKQIDFSSWIGKHLVRKNETYTGDRGVIYETGLPPRYRIIKAENRFMPDDESDTVIILVDENGDIVKAAYGVPLRRGGRR